MERVLRECGEMCEITITSMKKGNKLHLGCTIIGYNYGSMWFGWIGTNILFLWGDLIEICCKTKLAICS